MEQPRAQRQVIRQRLASEHLVEVERFTERAIGKAATYPLHALEHGRDPYNDQLSFFDDLFYCGETASIIDFQLFDF